MSKKRILKFSYILPIIFAILRIIFTLITIVYNPWKLSLRFIQIIPLAVYISYLFIYMKMYSDGVPVISIITPSLLHYIAIFIFLKKVDVVPVILLSILDIGYLIAKGVKASFFPFYIEGTENEEFTEAIPTS